MQSVQDGGLATAEFTMNADENVSLEGGCQRFERSLLPWTEVQAHKQ